MQGSGSRVQGLGFLQGPLLQLQDDMFSSTLSLFSGQGKHSAWSKGQVSLSSLHHL